MVEVPRIAPTPNSITVAALVEALGALIPGRRNPNSMCWCSLGRDIKGFGHEDRCMKARAALVAAGAFPSGYTFDREDASNG